MAGAVKLVRAGAPSYLTPEMQRQICVMIEAGNSTENAARTCGIGDSTVELWLTKGRAGEEPYKEFLGAVTRARGIAEAIAVKAIASKFDEDWKAAESWLKKARYKDWGEKQQVDLNAKAAEPELNINQLTPAEKLVYFELRLKATTSEKEKAELTEHIEFVKGMLMP